MVNFFRLCAAVFFISAMNISWAAGKCVSTTVMEASYYDGPCFDMPRGSSATVETSRYRALPNGAVEQRVGGGITMNAGKVKAPWYGRFGWTRSGVQKAVRVGLKGIKRTGWGIIAGLVIEELLSRSGWWVDEDGQLVYDPDPDIVPVPGGFRDSGDAAGQQGVFGSPEEACGHTAGCARADIAACTPSYKGISPTTKLPYGNCTKGPNSSQGYGGWIQIKQCPANLVQTNFGCADKSKSKPVPVTPQMLDDLDLSDYRPSDRDVEWFKEHLGQPQTQHYDSIPSVQGQPQTTVNPDGSTTETQTQYQPQINPQDGSYTPNPSVTVRERTTERRYRDGKKEDEKTKDVEKKPDGGDKEKPGEDGKDNPGEDGKQKPGEDGKNKPNPGEKPNPGGTLPNPDPDAKPDQKEKPQLKDCALMPTLCKWMKWTQEDVPDEPDLEAHKREIDVTDIEQHKTISFGAKRCPAPYALDLAYRSYQFEFDQYCEFARNLRLFVLAAAYIFAARILIGSARS